MVKIPMFWMGLAGDDAPLVVRDQGLRDLYALKLSTDRRP
jgi:hypothetical protein